MPDPSSSPIRFPRRRALALLGALAVVLAALAVGLGLAARTLGPQLARERVEAALAAALGRPVRVERVALELWRGRVVLHDLAIAAGPTWQAGAALEARRLAVGARLASLWHRELVVGAMLEDAVVRLGAGEGAAGPPSLALPERLALGPITVRPSTVAVRRADISYRDPSHDLALAVTALEGRVSPTAGGVDVRLRAARVTVTAGAAPIVLDDVSAAATLGPDRIRITRAGGRFAGEPIEVRGEIEDSTGARRLALDVQGRLTLPALARSGVLLPVVEGTAGVRGRVGGTAGRPTFAGRLAAPTLAVQAAGRRVAARRVEGDVTWDGRTLTLSDVSAETLGGRVEGSLTLPAGEPAAARLRLRAEALDLTALQSLAGRDAGLRGRLSGEGELQGDVRRPLEAAGQVRADVSRVTLPGALGSLGAGTAAGEARLGGGGLDVARLEATWPALHVRARGRATPAGAEGLLVSVTGDLARLAALAGRRDLAGEAVVDADVRGPWSAPHLAGHAELRNVGLGPVRLDRARLPFAYAARAVRVEGGEANLGSSVVELAGVARFPSDGALDAAGLRRLRLEVQVRAPAARAEDLAAWLPADWPASGRFTVLARVEGTPDAWTAAGQARSARLTVRGEAVEDVSMAFAADARSLEVSRLSARVRNVPLTGGGAWRWEGRGQFYAEVRSARLDALLAPSPAWWPAGRVDGRAEFTISRDGVSGTARLSAEDVAVGGLRLGHGQAHGSVRAGQVGAEVRFPAARLTATVSGRLDGAPLALRAEWHDVDGGPILARWLPGAAPVVARGSLVAELRTPPASPRAAQGTIRIDPLVAEFAGETWRAQGPIVVERTPGTTRVLRAEVASGVGTVTASGSIEDGGAVSAVVRGRVPLGILPTLHRGVRDAAGTLAVTVRIGGRLPAVELGGEGTVSDGQLSLAGLEPSLRDIRGRFTLADGGLRLEEVTAAVGGGTLRARGDVNLEGARVRGYRTELTVRRVALEPIDGLHTVWDADLEVVGAADRGQVRGEARLLRGRYDRDLSLVRMLLDRRPAAAPAAGGPHLDVRLALQDNLTVTTDAARLRVGGALQLQGATASPIVFGTLAAREGQLVFRRHRFEVTHAIARFVDPRRIDPFLDVHATARIQTYDVRLAVSGRADNLEVRLASTPALPEEDLLALVAFGRTREQLVRSGAGLVVGEAAGLLVRELFGAQPGRTGLDVLELDRAPETGETTLHVGKQVAPRTLVVYSQGVENTEHRRLRIEYRVLGPLAVAGEQDFRGGFGADVLLRIRFR